MRSSLLLLAALSFSGSAYAADCSSQFSPSLSSNNDVYTINPDSVELRGLGSVFKTTSEADARGSAECINVMNETVHLPWNAGRIVSVELEGDLAIYAEGFSSDAYARVDIDATAFVDGKSKVLQKAFEFSGSNPGLNQTGLLGVRSEDSSVCGKDIRLEVRKIAARFDTVYGTQSNVSLRGVKLRVKFAPVDPNDSKCINRPNAAPSANFIGIPFASGQNVEIVSVATEKCVDIAEYAMWNAAGAQQWDCAQTPNQLFRVTNYGDNMTLQALHSNQCLTIGGGAGENGALTTQTADCSSPAAHIKLVPGKNMGNAFNLRSANNGKCLDVHDGHLENGLRLQQWDCVGNKWQEWWINPR